MTDLKEKPFDELIDLCSNKALSSLLIEGGVGLKRSISEAMRLAIDWQVEKDLEELAKRPTDTQIAEIAFELVRKYMSTHGTDKPWIDVAVNDLIERCNMSYGHVDVTLSIARSFIRMGQQRFFEEIENAIEAE